MDFKQKLATRNKKSVSAIGSENKNTPRTVNTYVTGNQAIVIDSIYSDTVNLHGQTASVSSITQTASEFQTKTPFDNIVISTWNRINNQDLSKHVSTRAERSAYRILMERGRIFIRGKSGSGKSRLALILLGRVAKKTKRIPVVLSSWQTWELIPKRLEPSVAKDGMEKDCQYVVLIDDIFGSSNFTESFVNHWSSMFEIMWPDVECGYVLLVLTCRPNISSLCEYVVKKYPLMRNMSYIDLDEGIYSLSFYEKWQMLNKICGNVLKPNDIMVIATMNTALGFPQSCTFFASSREAMKMQIEFFKNPYRYVLEEIDCLWQCDGVAYLVLLIVFMKGGSLDPDNFSYTSTTDFRSFVENLRQCCSLSQSPTLGCIRDKADSLCNIYLTDADEGYTFQHQSIADAVFLTISKRDPKLGIGNCPARLLKEYVKTSHVERSEVIIYLPMKHYGVLVQRITEILLSEEYSSILDHPCLQDEEFVKCMVQKWSSMSECGVSKLTLRHQAPVWVYGPGVFDIDIFTKTDDQSEAHDMGLFSYTTVLAGINLKNLPLLVQYVLSNIKSEGNTRTLQLCTDLLASALYVEDNTLIQTLFSLGLMPTVECFRVLCHTVHIQRTVSDNILVLLKDNIKGLEDLELLCGCAVMKGNTHLVKMIIHHLDNTDHAKCQQLCARYLECFITRLTPYQQHPGVHDAGIISDMVELLLATGCSFIIDKLVWLAASHPNAAALKVLLRYPEVNPNQKYAHQYNSDPVGDRGATTKYPEQLTNALHQASAYGCTDCLSELLDYCKRMEMLVSTYVNQATETHTSCFGKFYPLNLAAMFGKTGNMRLLIDAGADVNIQNYIGQTALHLSLLHGKIEAVKLLLAQKVSLTISDYEGHTAVSYLYGDPNLSTSEQLDRIDILALLLESGCDITVVDGNGKTLLHRSVVYRDRQTVAFLCDKGFDLNHSDSYGNTVLGTATEWSDVDIVKCLCERGARMEAFDKRGRTMLHIAAKSFCNPMEKLKYFIDDKNLDVNTKDKHGRTALFDAVRSGNAETVEFLLEKGVDVNHPDKDGKTALFLINPHNVEFVGFLIDNGVDVNHKDNNGRTAIFSATESGYSDTVRVLLERCLDIHLRDIHGRTLLHAACERPVGTETLESVLDMGIDPNIQDIHGNTALHLLCKLPYLWVYTEETSRIIQLFVDRGAILCLNNNQGQTALDMAVDSNMENLVKALRI